MNERIKELIKTSTRPRGPNKKAEFDKEYFAELIIKECADVVLNTSVEYIEVDAMHRIRDNIKANFGFCDVQVN